VDGALVVQGAVLGGQIGEGRSVGGCEHRWRGAVLYLDQREACDHGRQEYKVRRLEPCE
jgi:hypothetical protein